ncbi:PKD domain-containing protein [Maribellus sediminis]|uniref:PKD domain-containing protein n=1 Tax=Maribellus sediminis TaxID=2696285 RepID=UPI00197ECDD9|nr:PKD domain-containing protein [Maribellus sediminis]
MKKSELLALLMLMFIGSALYGQTSDNKFKMAGTNPVSVSIDQTFSKSVEIFPFSKNENFIYGLDISANIELKDDNSLVRLVLIDSNFDEYLIYESYNLLLEEASSFSIINICEETAVLDRVKPYAINIELENASLELTGISYATAVAPGLDVASVKKEKKKDQNEAKIRKINNNLKKKGRHWVAGETSVSELSYGERKNLYGQSTFPNGFEFYSGGVIQVGSEESTSTTDGTLKSATTATSSPYVDEWDWRDRHGKNWITSIKSQSTCGSCWAFAATGATEAMANLYYNQQLNLDLSEQDLVSCSGAGDCGGGYPSYALDYIKNNGIVDEATFPYSASEQPCTDKGNNAQETIKIGGRIDFGSDAYPKTEDVLKDMLIKMGPLSSGQANWAHAMVLVGYKTVKEGDILYYRDLDSNRDWVVVEAGDPLIGKIVWIYKNSWGDYFGDNGYVYTETTMNNVGWTHALMTPFSSINNYQVKCEDRDGDGYYWWGLGPKPATCTGPDTPDGNDADPTLGPLDDFGHCIVIGGQPLANFSSDNTSVVEGESVQFTDFSENALTREWTFNGGTPATSTSSSPSVQYNAPGIYDVSLTVYNNDKSDTKTISGYIIVEEYGSHYCESNGEASTQWIESVQFGSQINTSGSSGTAGYQDLTNYTYNVDPGSVVTFTLTPNFSGREYLEVWKIWIDYNGDLDFDDSGELIYTSPVTSYPVSKSTTIPSNLNIKTRMRVSMKRNESPTACEIFSEGEVEDYTIQIGTPNGNSPIANFTSTSTTVDQGETVSFTDASSNNPTSWSWTFEGGTPATSTAQNPTVTYSTAGRYNVTLTAGNADGSDTKTVTDYIRVNAPVIAPVANFSANQSTITEGESVTFSDLSTNSPTSWSWTFGGGTPATSTVQNPVVKFNTPGTYSVSLTATNSGGSDTKTATGFITVNRIPTPPVAAFTADITSIKEGESVSFTDHSTNTPTSWNWTFAGGSPSTSSAQNPSITYNTAGTYAVTLTAINGDGSDTKTITSYITVAAPAPPVVHFTASQRSVPEGNSINFTDLSTNNPDEWYWEFPGGTPGSSNEQYPAVVYNTTGTYNVTLTATNADGTGTLTLNGFIEVTTQPVITYPPVAAFSYSAQTIDAGESISFTDESTNSPTTWSWTFEGGTPAVSTAQNPTITYNAAGTYGVSLTVTNDDGSNTKSLSGVITVNESVNVPVADFSSDKIKVNEGESVNFSDKSLNNPASWKWDFEGGNPSTSNERNPKVTYSNANSYKVSLTVTNAAGQDIKVIDNYIQVEQVVPEYCIPSPLASEEWITKVSIGNTVKTSGSNGGYADFTSTVFMLESGSKNAIELVPGFSSRDKFEYWSVWIDYDQNMDFTDDEKVFIASKSKSSVSGSITIPANLELTTRMRVAMGKLDPTACGYTDLGEVEDYTVQIMAPQPLAPVAEYAANLYTINVGESIQFSDISANNPTSWAWSFSGGNPATSTNQNPTVTYASAGTYNVTFTATNSYGSDTKTGVINVLDQGNASYCTPVNINSTRNYIESVTINSTGYESLTNDGYSLSNVTIDMMPGQSHDITLIPSLYDSRNFWRIWIDFNNDGDFDDSDETILAVNNSKGDVISSILIPDYAYGIARMRVSMKTGKTPAACDDDFEGEVEDYEVSFGGAAPGSSMPGSSADQFEPEDKTFLSVYPNPTENNVTLQISVLGDTDSYAVYNSTGAKIIEDLITSTMSTIELSSQPSGFYFVVINSGGHQYSEKIIKK